MHKNARFNILQANGNCNPNFVVIDGQRTNSGHAEFGAKVVSLEMPRAKAIALADKMQTDIEATRAAGYTVHKGEDCDTFAYCIDGDYSREFDSENAAWDAAVTDHHAAAA